MVAHMRLVSSRVLEHQACPYPMKKRCSGVKPSIDSSFWPRVSFFQAMVSQHQPTQVGDIFAHGQLAVDLDVIHCDIVRVLVRDATGALVKLLAVLRRPPVAQIALGIELPAFIVKAVGQFVSDGGAGVAVIRSIVCPRIEKGRLQDARREN